MNQVRGIDGPRVIVPVCCLLVAISWMWPVLLGPKNEMLPNLVAWASAVMLFVLLPLARERTELAIASGWVFAAVVSSVIALLQFFDLENGFAPFVVVTRPGHVLANVHQVNLLATLLGVGLLSLRWMALHRYIKPFMASVIALLLIVGIAATASRTGLMSAVLVSALIFFWEGFGRKSWFMVVAGVLAYAIAAVLLPWLQEAADVISNRDLLSRFSEDSACSSRLVIWANVLQLMSLKPLTGWGWDGLSYAHYITPIDGVRFCEKLSHAHNLPLQLAVSSGIPAAIIILAIMAFMVVKLKPWTIKNNSEQLAWGVLLLLGFHSLLEYPLWFGVPQVMAILAVWIVFRAHQLKRTQVDLLPAVGIAFTTRSMAALLTLSALTYIAWDYFRVSQLYTPVAERHLYYKTDTLNKVKNSWLFQHYVLYAVVNATTVDEHNAVLVLDAALEVLKDFPDPEIIVKVIRAAELTGNVELSDLHANRFESAWPKDFSIWRAEQSKLRD